MSWDPFPVSLCHKSFSCLVKYLIQIRCIFNFPFFFFFSGALTQAIRNFAKSLESWLSNAMNAIPQRMIQTKVQQEIKNKAFLYGINILHLAVKVL